MAESSPELRDALWLTWLTWVVQAAQLKVIQSPMKQVRTQAINQPKQGKQASKQTITQLNDQAGNQ